MSADLTGYQQGVEEVAVGYQAGYSAFDHTNFSKNRGRLLEHEVAGRFFHVVVVPPA